jgi:hypothetical protein
MRSGLVVRRWAIASAMSLLMGCGPEVLEEKHTQEPVTSGEQEMVGGSCYPGETLCNGVCTDTYSDVNNCGGCGHWCPRAPEAMCHSYNCYVCDYGGTNCVAI